MEVLRRAVRALEVKSEFMDVILGNFDGKGCGGGICLSLAGTILDASVQGDFVNTS